MTDFALGKQTNSDLFDQDMYLYSKISHFVHVRPNDLQVPVKLR